MSLALTNFMLLSLLTGAVLGIRLRVIALMPAMLVGLPLAVLFAIAQKSDFASTAALLGAVIFGLQIGYVCGSVMRFYIAASRLTARRTDAAAMAKQGFARR